MKKAIILIILLIIVNIILASAFIKFIISPTSKYNEIVYFEIKQGEGANSIANKLKLQGLIRNAKLFSLISKYLKYDRKLLSGYYELNRTMSMMVYVSYPGAVSKASNEQINHSGRKKYLRNSKLFGRRKFYYKK